MAATYFFAELLVYILAGRMVMRSLSGTSREVIFALPQFGRHLRISLLRP